MLSDADLKELLRFGPKPGSLWRHYKGGTYLVLTCALHEADLVPMVLYRKHEAGGHIPCWCRPLSEWDEVITVDGERVERFKI